jgi:hypothetical protein
MTDEELETLYNNSQSWEQFFGTIFTRIEISDFCMFISEWIDSFIQKYFNNLQGLTYHIPIKNYNISLNISNYQNSIGGRRYTRKASRKQDKDYK